MLEECTICGLTGCVCAQETSVESTILYYWDDDDDYFVPEKDTALKHGDPDSFCEACGRSDCDRKECASWFGEEDEDDDFEDLEDEFGEEEDEPPASRRKLRRNEWG